MSTEITAGENRGSLTGSILMIAGCCIGAGMISLPAVTALCGFLPSTFALLFSWAFMVSTGLLLLEVNLLFPKNTNLLTMTHSILGRAGKGLCAGLFVFLFYSLIIAYFSGTGILLTDFFSLIFKVHLPPVYGNILCALFLLFSLMKGTSAIDWTNRIFVLGMIISFAILVMMGLKNVQPEYLTRSVFGKQVFLSLPVLLISFGYQNLIPSITTYLGKNKEQIRRAIIIGCSIPLLVYLIWEVVILGMLSADDARLLTSSGDGEFIVHFLQRTIASPYLFLCIQLFSLFALLTSLAPVGLSFHDFLRDQMRSFNSTIRNYIPPLLVVAPPLLLSILIPNLFLKGLSLAGGLGAVLLFGVLPVIMSWNVRYKSTSKIETVLPGGKTSLVVLMIASIMIFLVELFRQFHFLE